MGRKRNPARLDSFYNELKWLHKKYTPDLRFIQLLDELEVWSPRDLYYIEEDEFLELLKDFLTWKRNDDTDTKQCF